MWSLTQLLPIAVVAGAAYALHSKEGWRAATLMACTVTGALVVLLTESLSVVQALSRGPLVLAWALAASATCAWATHVRNRDPQVRRQLSVLPRHRVLWAAIAVVLGLTLTTALAATPNTWDSLTYHMARVAHWTQNRSVAPYPTHNLRQLHQGPFAEFAILHSMVLSGTDRYANLVQWAAVLLTGVAVSLIARMLGASARGQLLAALVWIATPMAVAQASTTQTDAVAAMWLTAFVALAAQDEVTPRGTDPVFRLIVLGACLGLAALTKSSGYVFGLPIVVWFVAPRIKTGRGGVLRACGILFGVALLLNLGHFIRNFRVEHSPLGSAAEGINGTYAYANESHGAGAVVSNVVRNIALNVATRSTAIDARVEGLLVGTMRRIGIDPNDPRTTWTGEQFHVVFCGSEDCVGNPLELLLFAVCFAVVLLPRSRSPSTERHLTLCVVVAFLLFCAVLKWQPWNSRLLLPLFALSSPVAAAVIDRRWRDWRVSVLAVALVMAGLPFALLEPLRPLVGARSVFHVSRELSYVEGRPSMALSLQTVVHGIAMQRCEEVGLVSSANAPEYALWVFARDQMTRPLRIEHIGVSDASRFLATGETYRGFDPCAVVTLDTITGPAIHVGHVTFLRADTASSNPQLYLPAR